MAQYTTKQAQEAYEEALKNGYGFNAKDAELIQSNPDSFMRIYGYKKGYLDAQSRGDKTAMENYNKMAEQERKQLGYTSGKYGADVNYIEGPSSYQAPSFQYSQQDAYNQALGKITNRPDYTNQYQEQYDNKLNEIMKPQNWNYNSDNDQAYQSAKKAYLREADRATANTMGQAAAANGGMVSTANTLAAQQAGDYYRSQLDDNLANFIDADYGRYQDNLANKYNQLSALQNADAAAYQKYIDSVGLDFDTMNALMSDRSQQYGEYESGRNFDYGKYTDQLSYDTDKQATELANKQAQIQSLYEAYDAFMEQKDTASARSILNQILELQGITPPQQVTNSGGSGSSGGSSTSSTKKTATGGASGMTDFEKEVREGAKQNASTSKTTTTKDKRVHTVNTSKPTTKDTKTDKYKKK